MPTALVNGVRLNYVQMVPEDVGDEPLEDLVMVHGLATNMAFWYFKYAPVFAKRFRVTMFDLRGHGRSEMPARGYAPATLALDLQSLLDHLDIQRAHLLAHSFGGVVAMNFASVSPDRVASLVLCDSHISALRHVETPQEWTYGQAIQPILDRHELKLDTRDPYFGYKLLTEVAKLQMRNLEVPAELMTLVSPLMGKHGNRTAAQWIKLMAQEHVEPEMMGDDGLALSTLRKFRFPILAMYGDNSQARLTGGELLDVWPHAEFRRVRDAGHFFPTSKPEEVIFGCERFWGGEFNKHSKQRTGEAARRYFRSDRVYQSDGSWYCFTREQSKIGPFAESAEAHEHLARFVSSMMAAL